MMTKLRELSAVFLWILVIAFLALMVFEWGMDYTGQSRGNNTVGSVNGKDLSYQAFSELYQQLYQNVRSQNQENMTETQLQQLRDQVWEQFIQRTLFEEEMADLNITVSDSEVVYQIRNYPLEELKNNPAFQTDGVFDWNKYRSSFANPNMPWVQIEQFYRQQLPFQKLQNFITSTVRVSKGEVEEEFVNENAKVSVEYLEIPFAKFNDREADVSDEQARAYYDEHIEDYHRDEARELSYVLFDFTPTKADTQRTLDDITEIKERLAKGEDFNDLADIYSEDPAVTSNHGQYDYFERGAMVKPFEEAAFSGKVGELVGPVETQFGLHLIKIEDRRKMDGKLKAKVSHILLKYTAGPSTREQQDYKASLFREDASEQGFEALAEKNSYTIQKTGDITEKSAFIPGFGQEFQIIRFAFSAQTGDISDVIQTDKGYVVLKLDAIKPEGARPFDEVKGIVINKVRFEQSKQAAREFAQTIMPQITADADFAKISAAQKDGKLRTAKTPLFSLKASVANIGYNNTFNATAFTLDPGEVSGMVETNRGLYFLRCLEKSDVDTSQLKSNYAVLEQQVLSKKRNRVFNNWYKSLKDNAEIVDNRKEFNL